MYDLRHQRFGNLTVLKRAGSLVRHKQISALWQCRCDLCGAKATYRSDQLRAGKVHCPCEQHRHCKSLIPLGGLTFGTLRVIGREPGQGHGARWRCRCLACGTERVTLSDKLRDGRVRCTRCPSEIAPQRDWSKEWPSWAPKFEDSADAIDDHGSHCIGRQGGRPRLNLDELDRREAARRPPGRPRLAAEEVARREAARKPPGRPCQDPCKQVLRDCLWRIAEAARAARIDPTGIVQVARKPKAAKPPKDRPFKHGALTAVPAPTQRAPRPSVMRKCSVNPMEAWARLPWRERKAAIWERARAA
jgi:hypothetical protein